ncbi:MAG: (Fe-S)-binding protein, partial [Deferribacteres bacterium]|nr:(Fe-S)-binding protein [Deferribacteres bacterium]
MDNASFYREASKCVRCGACKALCPTYLTTYNETMGARGRVALLGGLGTRRLAPGGNLAEKIFSCMLCGACRDLCPRGIDITEVIYQGRAALRRSYRKGRFLRAALKRSVSRPDMAFSLLRAYRRLLYRPLHRAGMAAYNIPEVASKPFKNGIQVYKSIKRTGRVAVFAGCSVNYFYPDIGSALCAVLVSKGYEVVVFRGESCCGAPFRAFGLEREAAALARKNIEHFNRVRAEAVISLCPTCTMVIRRQYPVLAGDSISNLMDVNEFLVNSGIVSGLEIQPAKMTYHDPCHLNFGLGVREEPRRILRGIGGVEFTEMRHAGECCGFAGFFSLHFREISESIGRKKIENILNTSADVVVTSCPGCIMHLENLK